MQQQAITQKQHSNQILNRPLTFGDSEQINWLRQKEAEIERLKREGVPVILKSTGLSTWREGLYDWKLEVEQACFVANCEGQIKFSGEIPVESATDASMANTELNYMIKGRTQRCPCCQSAYGIENSKLVLKEAYVGFFD